MEQDPLAGVAVFVAAARARTFTHAAERLGITKSAVGKSIARLEQRLGFRLFHRNTRVTRLTADGEAYLAACSVAIDEVLAAQAQLASDDPVLSGRLHVDMPVAFGRRVLLPVLMEIARPHPDLGLTLTFTDRTTDLLRDDVDLAIRFGALRDSSDLVARRLVTQARIICASPHYLARRAEPRTLADVAVHQCIVGTPGGPPATWQVTERGVVTQITPPATHRFSDAEAMVDAAVGGLGIVQLPASLVRGAVERGALQPVLVANQGPDVEVHAVWPRRRHLSARVRHVVEQLKRHAEQGRLD